MILPTNPFITSGYISSKYFCDREQETTQLLREIEKRNNIALASTRHMGKTGLILHCFNHQKIQKNYYTFFVDIYSTKSLRDFVFTLSKVIFEELKSYDRKALENFLNSMKSLQAKISFGMNGNFSFDIRLGDIQSAETTLKEIFSYLSKANKPCIIAINEFQQITNYTEKDTENLLYAHIQNCHNTIFIFAGSDKFTMSNLFLSTSQPFFQSASFMYLEKIPFPKYVKFVNGHFLENSKQITPETIEYIYNRFEGTTWYLQKILNCLYSFTSPDKCCEKKMVQDAIHYITESYKYSYSEFLFRLSGKQKELLIAIAKEKRTKRFTSANFIQKHKLTLSSTQPASRNLFEKNFITYEMGEYFVYDKFFEIWLVENF